MDTLDAPMSPDEKDPLHSSRKRWMLWSGAAFGVLLVALVVLIALLPTLLSGAWGRSLVVNAITPSVQGSVSLKDLSLSWGGPQQVRGLEIAGSNGDRVTADVEVAGGLWSLVKLSAPLQARLSCAVRSGTAEDGSLTILQMLRGSSSSAAHNATNAQAMPPAASTSTSANPLQALRGSVLEIVRVDVEVTGSGDRPMVAIENLRGTCTLLADGC